jgi:orotidine-5'-phosphate decarboxylase
MGLIFALDYSLPDEALDAVRGLRDHVDMFKVGLELFLAGGFQLVDRIEAPVFLDLKLYDIPETVKRATKIAMQHRNVELLSVHASGGRAMLKAAHSIGEDKIAAVTLLTSLDSDSAGEVGYVDTQMYFVGHGHIDMPIVDMIDVAHESGICNIICSPAAVGALKDLYPNGVNFIVPGIRLDEKNDDHVATGTPGRVMSDGATHIVVGRPIRDAEDPVEVARTIKERMNHAPMKIDEGYTS